MDLINQKREARITEINTLQIQFEVNEIFFLLPCQTFCIEIIPMNVLLNLCLCVFPAGLAEEAFTAGPRTTEADREAAKH